MPKRPAGKKPGLLGSGLYLILAGIGFLGFCILLWRPLPVSLPAEIRSMGQFLGGLLFFPGLGLVIWGRSALGDMYFVSSSTEARLFADHHLVTRGPYRFVRHPMYLGLEMVSLGGLFLYQNWTFVFLTLSFLTLVLRAGREEEVLERAFGEEWNDYRDATPGWLPRFPVKTIHPGASALIEVILLFLPAIPAYLWVWPKVSGSELWLFQFMSYAYVFLGTLFIGLRRWNLGQLGINTRGLWLSLACGLCLLAGRLLIILSLDLGLERPQFTFLQLAGNVIYYFGVVGLVEELLFRGLVYQALDSWRGARYAIWGSSIFFGLWHIIGQGPLIGLATFFIGVLFALLRWRAGGILGLILIHGLWDLQSVLLVAESNQQVLNAERIQFIHPAWVLVGLLMMLFPAFYLWLIHPRITRHNFT